LFNSSRNSKFTVQGAGIWYAYPILLVRVNVANVSVIINHLRTPGNAPKKAVSRNAHRNVSILRAHARA